MFSRRIPGPSARSTPGHCTLSTQRPLRHSCWLRGNESAQFFVIDQFFDGWIGTAQRALRITPNTNFTEPHGQRIVHQQPAKERRALANDQFNRFCGLNNTNNPGQNSQDACLTSRRHHSWWGWGREQTAVTRPCRWVKDTGLTFKLKNTPVYDGLP
jgi:hypothetical protein